jgi:hypothetical protein
MDAPAQQPAVLHADPEHGGIRFVVFLTLFFGLFIAFQIVVWVLERVAPAGLLDYVTFLSCLGAIPLALVMVWGVEKLLRRVWHSGLSFLVDQAGITVRDRRTGQGLGPSAAPDIAWSEPVGLTNWCFTLGSYPRGGRERRINKDWLCLASELQQEDARLVVFCFMPPARAEATLADKHANFHTLNMAELYGTSFRGRIGPPTRPALPNHLLHSKDGRYWLAERRRWEFGVELSAEDYLVFLSRAQAAFDHYRVDESHPIPAAPPPAEA